MENCFFCPFGNNLCVYRSDGVLRKNPKIYKMTKQMKSLVFLWYTLENMFLFESVVFTLSQQWKNLLIVYIKLFSVNIILLARRLMLNFLLYGLMVKHT